MSAKYERQILKALENKAISLDEAKKVLNDSKSSAPIMWQGDPEAIEKREILKRAGFEFPEIDWI